MLENVQRASSQALSMTCANDEPSFGLGLNWYLNRAVVFKFDYYQTEFGFNPAAPAVSTAAILRQDEKVFISRFQFGF